MAKVGFIGLGIMGQPMCANVMKGKHEVWVYDVDQAKVGEMAMKGARPVNSVQEIAAWAEYVIIMVPNSSHVEDVVAKLVPNLKPGAIVIDMSTIAPAASRGLASKVANAGGIMVDAPVVKSQAAAITGDLGVLVGCDDPKIYDQIKPLLTLMGKNAIRIGPNGTGLVMKLCHNTLVAEIQNGVNEMLAVALKAGIPFDSFVTAISYGGGQNFYLDSKAATIKQGDFTPRFPLAHMAKDLTLAGELVAALGLQLPGLVNCQKVYEQAMKEALHREDFSATFKVVEKKAPSKSP